MKTEIEQAGMRVLERGWLSSNNILFVGADDAETVLVDSGYSSHATQTVALVQSALEGRTLDRIVNTHLHSDHCGGNHALQQRYGCAIDVPSGEAAKVDGWNEDDLTYRATSQHCPRFERTGVVAPESSIKLGSQTWQVIGAPGHDPHSIALYEPETQTLISADALWKNGFGVVFPELDGMNAFGDVRRTLDIFSGLSIRLVVPGHGSPFCDATAALERAYRRLDGFEASPRYHARHAAKVLIKFHLLEVRQQPISDLRHWMKATPYICSIQNCHFNDQNFDEWANDLIFDLCRSKALLLANALVKEP